MFSSPKLQGAAGPRFDRVNRCQSAHYYEDDDHHLEGDHIKHALVQRNWFEVREKLMRRFPILTHEDVSCEPGEQCAMMRRLERKLEVSPAKLQRIISRL